MPEVVPPRHRVLVVGKSLIDRVARADGTVVERVGGSPLNVAVALGRLGARVQLLTALGNDVQGARIRAHAEASGVKVLAAPLPRTSFADARIDAAGAATYAFDIQWDLSGAPQPEAADWLHVGSVACVLQPGAAHLHRLVSRFQGTVSFDPNCRPQLTPHADLAAAEALVARSDVVKLSDEDAAFLLPGMALEDVLTRWRSLGPRLVVVTRGAQASLALADDLVEVPVPPGDPVVDTVGAGDTFMAGLIAATGTSFELAAAASRLVVSRVGADPPWRRKIALDLLG